MSQLLGILGKYLVVRVDRYVVLWVKGCVEKLMKQLNILPKMIDNILSLVSMLSIKKKAHNICDGERLGLRAVIEMIYAVVESIFFLDYINRCCKGITQTDQGIILILI